MQKRVTKQDEQAIEEWQRNHGAATFDLKKRDIWLYDGGIIAIEPYKKKVHRMIGTKPLPDNKGSQVIFSKRKYTATFYRANMWFEDLDDTIAYFQSMKRMLNRLGYKTTYKKVGR